MDNRSQANAKASIQVPTIDESLSFTLTNQLTRSACSRLEEINNLKQCLDHRTKKVKNYNPDIFEEIRLREIQRINLENSNLSKLANYKVKEEDKAARERHLKGCKRIYKIFWNQFKDEDETQDL